MPKASCRNRRNEMIVTPIKTRKVTAGACTIFDVLDEALAKEKLAERSVVVVSSKIVSLCENRVLPIAGTDLQKLVREQAELYMPDAVEPQHGYTFTIAHNMLTPNSGIDESNVDGDNYVLWPEDPQKSANAIRAHLCEQFKLQELAVIITDGNALPLRWGAIGVALAYSGLKPVRSYKERMDLFGRPLKLTRTNVVDCLATAATLVMGEGAEQTPLAICEGMSDIPFTPHDPTAQEIAAHHAPLSEDFFGPLLTAVRWLPGGRADP